MLRRSPERLRIKPEFRRQPERSRSKLGHAQEAAETKVKQMEKMHWEFGEYMAPEKGPSQMAPAKGPS